MLPRDGLAWAPVQEGELLVDVRPGPGGAAALHREVGGSGAALHARGTGKDLKDFNCTAAYFPDKSKPNIKT